MDIETAEPLDALRHDIRGVESSLTAGVDHLESSLTAKIDNLEASLRSEMHALHADAKRHTDVGTESLRDDIRIIAEGVVALSAKVDTLPR